LASSNLLGTMLVHFLLLYQGTWCWEINKEKRIFFSS
jgi:hypothetical protein